MKTNLVTNKSINIKCYIAFTRFIENHDNEQLLTDLKEIETILIGGRKTDKTLWFRFFDGDLVNDYNSIKNVLLSKHNRYSRNYSHFIESIDIALNNISLQVYFS